MNDEAELGLEPSRITNRAPQVEDGVVSEPAGFDERLRWEAIEVDAERGVTAELNDVWLALLRGELVFADSFYTPGRWYAALAPSASPRLVTPRCRRLLTRLLHGESQKQTALDCGLGIATLSSALHRILTGMGVSASPCKAPPLLALMARAGLGAEPVRARQCTMRQATLEYRIVSVPRPELQLASVLSRAEEAVLCLYVEGRTHAEIARERGRSERTIANQLASLFRRLGVSGRGELVARLVSDVSRCSTNESAPSTAARGTG